MNKRSNFQEEIAIVNIYVPNVCASNYNVKNKIKRKTLLDSKVQIDSNTIIKGDINNPLSPIGHADKNQQRNLRIN
jgi:hypothetical protein